MASQTSLDKQIKIVLKYDVSRPYFGGFRFSTLYDAQRYLRRTEYYNEYGDIRTTPVYVGKIDGAVICGALWNLMQYNPVRFPANPFLHNGKISIFRFVTDYNAGTSGVLSQVQGKLRDYLSANATANGQWSDEIETDNNGYVTTILNDGHTGPTYKKLCILRDAVKLITVQNCADFDAKRGPYRAQIIAAVKSRHPDLFGITPQLAQPTPIAPLPTPEYTEDKIYAKMDQVQITLDNRDYVSPELYEQAVAEMEHLIHELQSLRNQPTL